VKSEEKSTAGLLSWAHYPRRKLGLPF